MIQKFTCIPKSDYDVVIISNGTKAQITTKLSNMNNNEIPVNSNITYLNSFKSLITHLHTNTTDHRLKGKVVFMFFNGLEFIQEVIGDLIDHYSRIMHMSYLTKNIQTEMLENVYIYFDASISEQQAEFADPYDVFMYKNNSYEYHFNTMSNIAKDIIKKMSFMIGRVRGVFIDDLTLNGERISSIHQSFSKVERMSSYNMSVV